MLKTCSHCGIVNDNHVCPFSKRKKKSTDAHNIRQTNKWHMKSIEIRERDNYLCRICLLELFDTKLKYNPNELEVHHIEPLEFSPDLAFEDDNLISLCRFHHEKAEIGDIPKVLLKEIVLKDIRTISPLVKSDKFLRFSKTHSATTNKKNSLNEKISTVCR